MKKIPRRAVCLCLAVLLSVHLTATRGGAIQEIDACFTVADRVVLVMEDASMPFQQDGQWYVPHTVFTQRELNVAYGRSVDRQTAYLMTIRQRLSFDLAEGLCYDQTGRYYYNIRAIVRGDYVFFPLEMVANFFELSWSYRATSLVPMLRITDSSSTLTDAAFLDAGATLLQSRYNDYLRSLAQAEAPSQPQTPPVHTVSGQRVYLTVSFSSVVDAGGVLDCLEEYGALAAMAFTAEEMDGRDDLLRRLVAQGHAVIISLEEGTTQAQAIESLAAANAALWRAACAKTRLVLLTQEQAELAGALEALGYTVCGVDIDYGPYPLTGSTRAGNLYRSITGQPTRDVRVYLGEDKACLPGLENLLSRLEGGDCRVLAYRETLE